MATDFPKQLAQLVSLGVLHLIAEMRRRHPVGFINNDQIPFIGSDKLLLEVFVAGQNIKPGNQAVFFVKNIAGSGRLDRAPCQDFEIQTELVPEFILPLLDQTAGRNNEASIQIAAGSQFPDEKSCHDGFSRSGIVGQKKPKGLARQHFSVDRRDLVR